MKKLGDVEAYPPMKTVRKYQKLVHVKGDLYVFGGQVGKFNWIKSVDKFSLTSNTWSQVAEMYDDRKGFCTCAFMDKIFLFGGGDKGDKNRVATNSCLQFDTSDYSWNEVSGMNNARWGAACAVYEERIVVSGGSDNNYNTLNTVESYNFISSVSYKR